MDTLTMPAAATAADPAPTMAAHTVAASPMRLGVLIGERRWLVDLADAGEIAPLPDITAVPLTRDWFLGLVNLRGALHTVVDLSRFAGGAPTALDKDSRLLALGARLQFNATLVVSRMQGLRSTAGMRVQPGDAQAAAARPAWQGTVWVDDAGAAWQELSLARLVQDERLLQVAR